MDRVQNKQDYCAKSCNRNTGFVKGQKWENIYYILVNFLSFLIYIYLNY